MSPAVRELDLEAAARDAAAAAAVSSSTAVAAANSGEVEMQDVSDVPDPNRGKPRVSRDLLLPARVAKHRRYGKKKGGKGRHKRRGKGL